MIGDTDRGKNVYNLPRGGGDLARVGKNVHPSTFFARPTRTPPRLNPHRHAVRPYGRARRARRAPPRSTPFIAGCYFAMPSCPCRDADAARRRGKMDATPSTSGAARLLRLAANGRLGFGQAWPHPGSRGGVASGACWPKGPPDLPHKNCPNRSTGLLGRPRTPRSPGRFRVVGAGRRTATHGAMRRRSDALANAPIGWCPYPWTRPAQWRHIRTKCCPIVQRRMWPLVGR